MRQILRPCILFLLPFVATVADPIPLSWDGKKLKYELDTNGDTIFDFSHCGYAGGGVAIPDVPVKIAVTPDEDTKDDAPRIQEAIDKLAREKPDESGFRGAVLFKKGVYEIHRQLNIPADGIVLRGEGEGDEGTVLYATGTWRRTLITTHPKEPAPPGRNLQLLNHSAFEELIKLGSKVITKLKAEEKPDDDTARIQRAVTKISKLDPNTYGFCGTLLLEPGVYRVSGPIYMPMRIYSRSTPDPYKYKGSVVIRADTDNKDSHVIIETMDGSQPIVALRDSGGATHYRPLVVHAGGHQDAILDLGATLHFSERRIREESDPESEESSEESEEDVPEVVRYPIIEDLPFAASQLTLEDANGIKEGDQITIVRSANPAWLRSIGMAKIPRGDELIPHGDYVYGRYLNDTLVSNIKYPGEWKWRYPQEHLFAKHGVTGSIREFTPFEFRFNRTVTKVEENVISFDCPITLPILKKWGGGYVETLGKPFRMKNIGVEGFRVVSQYNENVLVSKHGDEDVPGDEAHCGAFVALTEVSNAWVRNCTVEYMALCAVALSGCQKVTIQDVASMQMVARIAEGRRIPYFVEDSEQILFMRCHAEDARRAFATGIWSPGPVAFVNCTANEGGFSGSADFFTTCVLFDNVRLRKGMITSSLASRTRNYLWWPDGYGEGGAYWTIWNCKGPRPPIVGAVVGRSDVAGFGKIQLPASLYFQQLEERLGKDAVGATANVGEPSRAAKQAADVDRELKGP